MDQNFNNAPDMQPDNRGLQSGTEQNNAAQYQQGNPYQQNNQYQQNNSYQQNNQYQQGNPYQQNGQYQQNNQYQQNTYDDYNQPEYENSDFVQPVYSSKWLTPAKKKFNPLVVIIPAVLLIAAAVVLYFLFFNKSASYRKAEENYFNTLFAVASGESKELKESQPQRAKIDVSVPAGNLAGIDLSDISAEFDTVVNGDNIYSVVNAAFAGKNISAQCWVDSVENRAIMLLPEISDIYAVMDIGENTADNSEDYLYAVGEVFSKAGEVYFELIGEPEVVKNQEFTVGDNTFTADKSVIHLDAVQLAKTAKAFMEELLENELLTAALCEAQGCESKDELLNGEIGDGLDRLDSIINGGRVTSTAFDMTVYMKNQTVIGREAVFINDDGEASGYINIYEIPVDNGQITCVKVKDGEEETLSLMCRDEVNGEAHSGTVEAVINENSFTASYKDLAVTENLFQGEITISPEDNPALVAAVSLKKEEQTKTVVLSVPNIVVLTITLQPSALEYKEPPVLSEGEYAVLTDENARESEAYIRFTNGISGFLLELLGYGTSTPSLYDYEASQIDWDNMTMLSLYDIMSGNGALAENTPVSNTGNVNIGSTGTPNVNTSENGGSKEKPDDSNVTENESAEQPSSTAENSEAAESQDNGNAPEIENTSASESAVTEAPENNSAGGNQYVPEISSGDFFLGQIKLSGAQYVSNSSLDAFNSRNPFKVEIYVDTAMSVNDKVTVSEKPLSEIDSDLDYYADYVKGSCLQIDFADDLYFDSAWVLFTIPDSMINSGRKYPNSDILSGINRYVILKGYEGWLSETMAGVITVSDNQIGTLTYESGHFTLLDMDAAYYGTFGMSPDEMMALYE